MGARIEIATVPLPKSRRNFGRSDEPFFRVLICSHPSLKKPFPVGESRNLKGIRMLKDPFLSFLVVRNNSKTSIKHRIRMELLLFSTSTITGSRK